MTSTYFSERKRVKGLSVFQDYAPGNYGVILNKAYTELLTNRYFKSTNKQPKDNRDKKYYKKAMKIATKVEELLGKEEMERVFFAGKPEYIVEMLNDKGIDGLSFMKEMYSFQILEDDEFFNEELNKISPPKKNKVKTKRKNK